MKINYVFMLMICQFYWNSAYADSHIDPLLEEKTMCQPHEKIYFSCPVDKKIISVCAFGNFSPKTGYIKYRFGRAGKPEFEFPIDSRPPMDRFSISDFYGGNVSTTLLKFKSGKYTYVVFQSAVSGVYVKKNGRTVRSLLCDAGQYGYISPGAKRGVKTVAPDDND